MSALNESGNAIPSGQILGKLSRALVVSLRDRGLATALATSSPVEGLDQLIALLGIADVLDATITAVDIESSKPDPGVFVTAMEVPSMDPARTMAIGESFWDVGAARGDGVACIAVESGGFSRHELSEAGALQVYCDIGEILQHFLTSPLAHLLR